MVNFIADLIFSYCNIKQIEDKVNTFDKNILIPELQGSDI